MGMGDAGREAGSEKVKSELQLGACDIRWRRGEAGEEEAVEGGIPG